MTYSRMTTFSSKASIGSVAHLSTINGFINVWFSLHVLYIRNVLHRIVKRSNPNISIEAASIYEHPTARSLGTLISTAVAGNLSTFSTDSTDRRAEELIRLVDLFTTEFRVHKGTLPQPGKETVLVTGTTGSLGIHVMKTLISLDSVQRIYCLNRRTTGKNARDRHITAANLQGIDVSIVDSTKVIYLEVEMGATNMGLSDAVIEAMRGCVTSVIHLGKI